MSEHSASRRPDAGLGMDEPLLETGSDGYFRRTTPGGNPFLSAVMGRWPWIILGLLVGLGGGYYYLSKAPRIYSATATVLVKQRGASTLLADKDKSDEIDMKSAEALNTVAAQLKRASILERVAASTEVRQMEALIPPKVSWVPTPLQPWLGSSPAKKELNQEVPAADVLARDISSWMTVTVRKGTRLIDLKVLHPNRGVAREIADRVIEEYLNESNTVKSDGRQSSIGLLKVEVDRARLDLEKAQKALGTYQQALKMQAELDQKDDEISVLSKRYLGEHPKMMTARAASSQLRGRFFQEIDRLRNSKGDSNFWTSVEGDLRLAENAADEERLTVVKRILLSRTAVLESEIRSQESVFNALLTKLQETDVNQSAGKSTQKSECESSSPAIASTVPESPVPRMALGMGGLLGAGLGAGLAALLSFLDNKFRSVAQVESVTGLPVLAAIGLIDLRGVKAVRAKQGRDGGNHQPANETTWSPLLVFSQPLRNSVFAEMYRILRAAVSLLGNTEVRKVTLFTSALPNEGKTVTSVNFAMAAAAMGKSVLLVDLDLRKPSIHKAFGMPRNRTGKGAAELLAGQCTLEEATTSLEGFSGLDLVLAGEKAPNPGELLDPNRVNELLRLSSEKYDLVVIDTAPMLAVPDTRLLAPLAHNRCLVIRDGKTPIGAVLAAANLLDQGDSPASGIVFNCHVPVKRKLRYGYGADAYGQYGYGAKGAYGVYGDDD
jgi:polysaccharide biosynthesis transport protein